MRDATPVYNLRSSGAPIILATNSILYQTSRPACFQRGYLMATDKKIRVAIVGLGYGAEFIPIYQNHPDAEMYAICRRDKLVHFTSSRIGSPAV